MTDPVFTELAANHADVVMYGSSLLLKAGGILIVAWVFSWMLRSRSAGLRHALWSTAFTAILALPLISAWMPPLEIDVLRLEAISQSYFPAAEDAGGQPVAMHGGVDNEATAVMEPTTPRTGADDAFVSAPAQTYNVARYLMGAWLTGVLGLCFIFLLQLVRIRRATKHAVSTTPIWNLAASIAREMNLRGVPRVLVGQVDVPLTWGIVRPVVILPVDATEWDRRKQRIVLMHEFSHIRRLDYIPHLMSELACIFYWPNPLVWIARERLRTEQELACDDAVIRSGTASQDYAELLLEIARLVHSRRLLSGGLRMAEREGLKARVLAILDPNVDRTSISRTAFILVLLVVAVPAFGAAALQLAGGTEDPEKAPPPAVGTASSDSGIDSSSETLPLDADKRPSEKPAFTLTMEAENGTMTAPMTVKEDDRASGGRYVVVPDQDGHDPPDGGPGGVSFQVDLQESASRAVWARVIGDHHNDNSFFISVDGSDAFRWDVLAPDKSGFVKQWTWLPVVDRSGEPLQLDSGIHTLTFHNREDGTRLDAVFMSSDPDLIPRGRSPLPPPKTTISIGLEAEEPTRIIAPLEIRTDEQASGRLYVSAARGFNNRDRVPDDGRATYEFEVPEDGHYIVWARAMARRSDDDSFWIRANGSDWVRWNGLVHDDDWMWQFVHDSDDDNEIAVFPLRAGTNTIQIAYREDGARVDRFVVSNDMYADPSNPSSQASGVTVIFR